MPEAQSTSDAELISNWNRLPRELVERIAGCLPQNTVACTLRCLNKATAAIFGTFRVTRLSQPVPEHAFTAHWGPDVRQVDGAADALRRLPCKKRLQLLCLTAASGSIPNLEVATASVAGAGCVPTEAVTAAAAAAGQLNVCQWLLERSVLADPLAANALEAAAEAGHRDVCALLLDNGYTCSDPAVSAAARGGHADLVEWLLQKLGGPPLHGLLVSIAAGCDLPTLRRFHGALLEQAAAALVPEQEAPPAPPLAAAAPENAPQLSLTAVRGSLALQSGPVGSATALEAAAQSPTRDWAAKVEWLEAQGSPTTPEACTLAAARPDAVERLAWLRRRGYPLEPSAVEAAAGAGHVAAVRYLLAEGAAPQDDAWTAAARGGHVAVLEALHGAGCSLDPQVVVQEAASAGRLAVVSWVVDALGGAEHLSEGVFDSAVESGDMQLMAWLHERGCPWDASTFSAAASTGNVVAMVWLVERGCPLPDFHMCYFHAISGAGTTGVEDMLTLRCLRRLGCPWGDPFIILNAIFYYCADRLRERLQVLAWLRDEGCPLDWEAARRRAEKHGHEEIAGWIAENVLAA